MANETELAKMVVRLTGESASYQKMLNQAQAMTASVAEKVAEAGKQIESLGKNVGAFGTGATAALAGITGGLGVTDAFKDFDASMAYSTSVMGLTRKEEDKLRADTLAMAADTGKSADMIAKGFYYMASAGMDAKASFAAMPQFLKFATAGQLELAQAVDLVAGVMGAARLKSDDANTNLKNLTRTTDVLARVSVLAQGNIQQFSEALSNDAAAAGQAMGKEIEEVTATLGAFALANNRGAAAGSDFSRMLIFLAKAARDNSEVHKKLGLKVFDAAGNMRNMADIIGDLENILGPMSSQMKGATLEALGFDARIQKLFVSTVGLSKNIRQFEGELRKAGGTTALVAGKVGDTLAGSFAKLKNTVTLVAIEVGQFLAPALRVVADGVKELVKWWLKLDPEVKQATIAFSLFGAVLLGIGPLTKVLSLLSPLITSMIGPVKIVLGLLTGFNPITALIWLAVAAVGVFVDEMGGLEGAWDGIKKGAVVAWNYVKDGWAKFLVWVKPITQALSSFFTVSWQKIKEGVIALWEWTKGAFEKLKNFIGGIWESITGGATVNWKTVQETIRDAIIFAEFTLNNFDSVSAYVWANVKLGAVQAANTIEYYFTTVLPAVLKWFGDNWQDVFKTLWSFTTNLIGNLVTNIVTLISNIPDLIKGTVKFDEIWTPLLDGFVNTIKELPDIPKREMGALEKELLAKRDAMREILGGQFDTFKQAKLAQFNAKDIIPDKAIDKLGEQAKKAGETVNKNMSKGAELQKFDSVLSNSIEALARIQEMRDKTKVEAPTTTSTPSGATSAVTDQVKAAMDDIVYTAQEATTGTEDIIYTATEAVDKAGKNVADSMNTFGENVAVGIANSIEKVGKALDDIVLGDRKLGVGQIYSTDPAEAAQQASEAATKAAIAEIPSVWQMAKEAFLNSLPFGIGKADTSAIQTNLEASAVNPNPTPQGNGPIEQNVSLNPQDSNTQDSILDVLKGILKTNEEMLKKPDLDIGTAGLA